ncbi:hypothetical protein FK535_06800 [Mycolicibacterium sp. 018/SC-01/001]|uniref:hypothetical protein n=1 Tax=Mycolicibacterium sp. 018/SC-01/001 TaxID=2592069 RepID=UPI001181597A|nr:hypothetical protein [Mycolicibacterium sp. 018/SC-01/001]TRW86180.1 hypothetical protein FK535_06800 [Mycolicibacterium sp. 018/SC-01/001]
MRFEKNHFSEIGCYRLGRETTTQGHFLGVPLSNSMIDYIEYYWLTAEQYDRFAVDSRAATEFADSCRRRKRDDILAFTPGPDRGSPR